MNGRLRAASNATTERWGFGTVSPLQHRSSVASSARDGTRLARELRRASYPPPYPDGWYRLLNSAQLRRGQLRYLECLGRALVIWRSEHSDDVFAMEAFCPHLGANLAHGKVRGSRVECPFHAWQLTGDGRVARVPYSDTPPQRSITESFPVEEVHGQILMYHRGGGTPQHAGENVPCPAPRVAEIDDGSFVYRGHNDAGRARVHMIELIENAADPAHFARLHNRMHVPWTRIPIPGVELEHFPRTDFDTDTEPWRLSLPIETMVKIRGRRITASRSRAVVTYTCAGGILNLRITTPGVGVVEIIQTQLPIGPLEQQVDFRWFAEPAIPRIVVWYIVGNWVSQWRNDVRIWQSKVFRDTPTLSRGDGPVMRLRRWYSQFYPESETAPGRDLSHRPGNDVLPTAID